MPELHPDLQRAGQKLAEAGIRAVKHGERLVQYAPGILGLYLMVTVERRPDGRLLVDGRTPDHAREVLIAAGLPVLGRGGEEVSTPWSK